MAATYEQAPNLSVAGAVVHVVACGSVDDGKSTLIGRLLAGTGSATEDQLDYARVTRRGGSTIPAGEVDYSLLTDGLEAEHVQGITIDVAYRHVYLPSGRRAIIADAPGHEQFTRNMAVAASTAEVAILLVDATRGIRPQTHRHLTVCALMGVREAIVAVNKLDAFDFDHSVFERLAAGARAAAAQAGIERVSVIPVSALTGDNVMEPSTRTGWYDGPAVLEALDSAGLVADQAPPSGDSAPLRLPVQLVVRADGFRGYAGTLAAGSLHPGDAVRVSRTAQVGTVAQLLLGGEPVAAAESGQPVVITLAEDIDIARGDLLIDAADASEEGRPTTAFTAEMIWTGQEPLRHGRSYLLQVGPRTVPAVVTTLRHRLDVVTGEQLAARTLELNDIGTVEISTDVAIPLDRYAACRDTGGFLLIDRSTRDTVAAGMVQHGLRRGHNLVEHAFSIGPEARARLKGQHPRVFWLTGLPGAGKSTLADLLERRLHAMGLHTYVLDGDSVRHGLNKDLGFTPGDRAENVRRVAEAARLMTDAGLVVIVSLVSPFRADRDAARALFAEGDFVEVFVDTPVEVCAARDTKGLYAKARAGQIPNMTGVGQGYEPPVTPEVVVAGDGDLEAGVAALVEFATS